MMRHFTFILVLLLVSLSPLSAQLPATGEFRYGYGGFAIRAGLPSKEQSLSFSLDEYQVLGNALIWERDSYRLSVSVCTALRHHTDGTNVEKAVVIGKWKAALLKELGAKAATENKPYTFENFPGTEIMTTAPKVSITRLFFLKSVLIAETISIEDKDDLSSARMVLDSFRVLNKPERTLALIDEFTPPPLAQERPAVLPTSDATEQGLFGAVYRVRDTFQPDLKSANEVFQETHFDSDGFTTVEITLNQGFPDVITTWGWEKSKRINLQSAVNFPGSEGPRGGRTQVISGSISIPGTTMTASGSRYGNLIEAKWDEKGRPTERRRFASSGSLVYVEHYAYDGDRCDIKTVDDSGGFISRIRNRLDAHNNILETETLFDNGSVAGTIQFEYQFDSTGNWTVKKAFRKSTVGRRVVLKPIGVYYRSISYYEETNRRQLS